MKKDFLDITELIRSIQRAEGNDDCFRRSDGFCDRLDCAWRQYCLETQQPDFFEKDGEDKWAKKSLKFMSAPKVL